MAWNDFGTFHCELAAFFKMPQQTSSKLNLVHELANNADQAMLFGVNPDFTRHFVKHFSLTGRRLEARIGLEGQFGQAAVFAAVLKDERVGNHLEKPIALLGIFSAVLFELLLFLRIVREPPDTFRLATVLGIAQRFSRN